MARGGRREDAETKEISHASRDMVPESARLRSLKRIPSGSIPDHA